MVLLAGDAGCGAFAAGTVDLRASTSRVQRRLRRSPRLFLGLAARHLLSPAHLLAGRAFDPLVPPGAGYVLTIGASAGSPARGREVLAALEASLAGLGARECWVDTEADNAAARRLYERAGYRTAAERYGQVLLAKAAPQAGS